MEMIGFDNTLKKNYPIVRCDDVFLHFSHYNQFDEANADWNRRKKRIDYNNLLFMMYTDDAGVIREFTNAPVNKVCFTTTSVSGDSICNLTFADREKHPLWKIVNNTTGGDYETYDLLDILDGIVTWNLETDTRS